MSDLHSQLSATRSRRGMALVIVLAIIVLVLGLCVGFLARVSTERNSSKGYASAVDARLLGASAVQIVQGQIDAATTQGTKVAWSSQPGLIRTYDDSGSAAKSYKLYSSGTMQTAGPLNPSTEAASMAGWFNNPALFTDINAPVDARFTGTADTWPILDPSSLAAGATNPPQGFSISGAPTGAYQSFTNPAPMPVQWLYVLKDGQIVAPTGSGSTATVAGADKSPIVGRIAFWTDDETCKINVNTASEGSYWDSPRFDNPTERALANYQPAKNEFQGYPGHPATTSLSTVFPELTRDQIFSLVPRLVNEGSKGGTVRVSETDAAGLDRDRLYSTRDELLFSSPIHAEFSRSPNAGVDKTLLDRAKFFVTTTSRSPETNLFNLPKVACWPIHASNSEDYRTSFDRLIAFCSTIKGRPFYFQRMNAASATADYEQISRNQDLYGYLNNLNSRAVPGFGGSLNGKYGADGNQILTEIFDYVRCINLYDGNLKKDFRYATGTKANSVDNKTRLDNGVVAPIQIGAPSTSTTGFGRSLTLTEAGIWFICTGDADVLSSNNVNSSGTFEDKNKTLPGEDDPATTWDDRILQKDSAAGTRQIRVESAMLLELFTPMMGYAGLRPDLEVKISGLENFTIKGNADTSPLPFGFPSESDQTESKAGRMIFGKYSHDVNGGYPTGGNMGIWWTLDGRGIRSRNSGRLLQDSVFSSSSDGGTGVTKNRQYPFVSEPVTVRITAVDPKINFSGGQVTFTILKRATGEVVQTISADMPAGTFPAPKLYTTGTSPQSQWTFQFGGAGLLDDSGEPVGRGRFAGDFGGSSFFPIVMDHDVVRSIVPSSDGSQGADFRLWAMKANISATDPMKFVPHPLYNQTYRQADSFMEYGQGWYVHAFRRPTEYSALINTFGGKLANMTQNYPVGTHPDTPLPVPAAQATGDWDNGLTKDADGAYINKPDEGNTYVHSSQPRVPYFESWGAEMFDVSNFFSPNRIMPSPGMFGSLPTGVARGRHWETLLFRRQPGHPNYSASAGGFTKNPDYLWMDLFWMPVVEPYAISEPLSTAGKINLNQQIVPFTWIDRSTGMHAILKQEKVASVPNSDAAVYKSGATSNYRRPVKIDETLMQLQFRFDNSDGSGLYAFRSPAEICDMHIIPDDASPDISSREKLDDSMAAYWAAHALTGDNSRERIYTTVYPRLTTKSNTFTVHFRAQALKQLPGATPGQWTEGKDVITADYRGSTTIERFIDPNDPAMPASLDYASNPDAIPTLDSLYHWRVRSHHQFAP